jgi:hypothetical protein
MSADVIHLRMVRGCLVPEKRRGSGEEGDVAQTALVRLVYCMAAWEGDGARAGRCLLARGKSAAVERVNSGHPYSLPEPFAG